MSTLTRDGLVTIGLEDADELFEVAKASDLAEMERVDFTHSDITDLLRGEHNRAWGLCSDGILQGAVWVLDRRHRAAIELEILLPESASDEIAAQLLDVALDHCRRDPQRRPVHAFSRLGYDRKESLFTRYAGSVVRHFFRMEIDLTGWTPRAAPPPGISIAPMNPDTDLPAVHRVVDTAFEDHWQHASAPYDEWVAHHTTSPTYDPTMWWLARRDGSPVAALIGTVEEGAGYVAVLGTLREVRRSGVGAALLRTAFDEFARRGCGVAGLHCDAANPTGAVRLYESVGMHVALHYACYEIKP